MTLASYAKKLRQVAEQIDDLLGLDRPTHRETPATAAKIVKSLKKGYNGKHWTQRPENKTKLRRMLKRSVATRNRVS